MLRNTATLPCFVMRSGGNSPWADLTNSLRMLGARGVNLEKNGKYRAKQEEQRECKIGRNYRIITV